MATPAWNDLSAVCECEECEGTGWVAATRRATINDPYPERRCDLCEGEPPCCPVCGFDQIMKGWDCYVCETVDNLFPEDLAKLDVESFVSSFRFAVAAARKPVTERRAA